MNDPFEGFRFEAFRIELLPNYLNADGTESEGFLAWKATHALPPDFNSDWVSSLENGRRRKAAVRRLRLVSSPLSEYENYQIQAGYCPGEAAGEDIRIALRSSLPDAIDAWIFDRSAIRLQLANPDGSFVGSVDGDVASQYNDIMQRAIKLFDESPKLTEYRERRTGRA